MVGARQLEQSEQVTDLMVAPVADVRPGIPRLEDLPVHARSGDVVRVVPVGGRGVDELADHAVQVLGKGEAESFPVLEDVAPVPLVVQTFRSIGVLQLDREVIPGAAGVAMAPAERDGKVLLTQPLQLQVSTFPG